MSETAKKLYEVGSKRWYKVAETGEPFFFDHLDGMYSYCKDQNGQVVHYAGWTEVVELGGFWNVPDKSPKDDE